MIIKADSKNINYKRGNTVIVLGVICLILGLLLAVPVLWSIGVILVVVGLILALLGMAGHAVGGRAHYW
jgi:uncharacterized membrane protein HdeD (DUF308 family)